MADIRTGDQRVFLGLDFGKNREISSEKGSAKDKANLLEDAIKDLEKSKKKDPEKLKDLRAKLKVLEGYIDRKEYDKAFFDYNLDGNLSDAADQAAQQADKKTSELADGEQRFFNGYDQGKKKELSPKQRISIIKKQIKNETDRDQKRLLESQLEILEHYEETKSAKVYSDYNLDGVVDEKDDAARKLDQDMAKHADPEQRFFHGFDIGKEKELDGGEMEDVLKDKLKEANSFEESEKIKKQLAQLEKYRDMDSGMMYLDYNLDGKVDEADEILRAEDAKLNDQLTNRFLGHKFKDKRILDNDDRMDALKDLKKASKDDKDLEKKYQAKIDQLNKYIDAGDQESIEKDYNLDGVIDKQDEDDKRRDILKTQGKDPDEIDRQLAEEQREQDLADQAERVENTIAEADEAVNDVRDAFSGTGGIETGPLSLQDRLDAQLAQLGATGLRDLSVLGGSTGTNTNLGLGATGPATETTNTNQTPNGNNVSNTGFQSTQDRILGTIEDLKTRLSRLDPNSVRARSLAAQIRNLAQVAGITVDIATGTEANSGNGQANNGNSNGFNFTNRYARNNVNQGLRL